MHYLLYILILLCPFTLQSEEQPARKSVCLNMIVKNESKVITRCLTSVLPLIDYWVIVDTGSTDGTQQIIKDFMKSKGIPGELYESPWKNFAYNRNEALQFAKGKGDYVLFIDADEVLKYQDNFALPKLELDCYYITTDYGGAHYIRVGLINNNLNWKWEGILHEYILAPDAKSYGLLRNVSNIPRPDGARSSDPQKYQKDALLLEKALEEEPNNYRYVFYLAQSYRDAAEYPLALKNYEKYVTMQGGSDEEKFCALLQIGMLQEQMKLPFETVIEGYNRAYQFRPTRAEPLYRMANYYRRNGDNATAYLLSCAALSIPKTRDLIFTENWVYEFGTLFEFGLSACNIGRYEEGIEAFSVIVSKPNIPENLTEYSSEMIRFANDRVEKIGRVDSPIKISKEPLYINALPNLSDNK